MLLCVPVHCQRMNDLNERYNSCRAKTADYVTAAVKRKEDVSICALTYKILNTTQPPHLYDIIFIHPRHGHNTCSSPYVTLIKPSWSLRVTHRSFRHASPHLWNQLPTSLGIPHLNYSFRSQRPSLEHPSLTCYTLLSPSIPLSLFHFELKTYLFRNFILVYHSLFLSVGLISWL